MTEFLAGIDASHLLVVFLVIIAFCLGLFSQRFERSVRAWSARRRVAKALARQRDAMKTMPTIWPATQPRSLR